MWHTAFIVAHAATATVAVLVGMVAMPAGRYFEVYRATLVGTVAFLMPAILLGWEDYGTISRVIFPVLLLLGLFMVARAVLAGRMLPATTGGPTAAYLDHIGFTLISLADGFVIVALLRAGVPGWLVAVSGVAVVVIGHFLLRATRHRLVRPVGSEQLAS